LLLVFSGFKRQLPFECNDLFEKEATEFFPDPALVSKQEYFLPQCLTLLIALKSAVL
jgi:hypothetical protein